MQHLVGMDDLAWRQQNAAEAIVMDTRQLINGHGLIAGMSGTGKSHQVISYLNALANQGIEADVFDVHEELHVVRGAAAVKFSEATKAGYNPLVLSTDPHTGGVRKQIEYIIDMMKRTSTQLGARQETAVRNLVGDVYRMRGIYPDNPSSWHKQEITERAFDELTRANQWSQLKAYYPVLRDVISYCERQLKIMSIGGDVVAVNALERVEKTAARLNGLNTKFNKAISDEEVDKLKTQMEAEKEKAIEAYIEFIRSIETGREMQDIHRYTNRETLVSVLERLQRLQDGGIFASNPPQWGGSGMRIYQVGALGDDERRLLFFIRAQQILRECMDTGKTDDVRRVILVDEGHLYYSEDSENPLNRIAKEGRKFGLGLVISSQSPTHFSEDFLTNCGFVMLTGLHSSFWDKACRQMKIEPIVLKATRAREVVSLKLQRNGEADAQFRSVNVDYDVVKQGVQRIKASRMAA